jgi:hypothetical protein
MGLSVEAAREVYRVAITPDPTSVDAAETKRLRDEVEETNRERAL